LRDLTAYSRDYNTVSYVPHIDGILGFDFFAQGLLTLDYPSRRVRFSGDHLPVADGKSVVPLEMIDGNPYVAASLSGEPVKLLIDSGNIRAIDIASTSAARL